MNFMSGWMIFSWICVAAMTAINVFLFLKLKGASEQMLKMAFPNAKNMSEAMTQMQKMMGGRMPNMGAMGGLGGLGGGAPKNSDAQLKQAMAMLQNKKGKK
jgi:glycerate kinase